MSLSKGLEEVGLPGERPTTARHLRMLTATDTQQGIGAMWTEGERRAG